MKHKGNMNINRIWNNKIIFFIIEKLSHGINKENHNNNNVILDRPKREVQGTSQILREERTKKC